MSALIDETLKLRSLYDEEPSHSDQVTLLALQIYDGLKGWHKLGTRQRELLHSGALLHDIGWSQTPDGKAHHKWSARLVVEHRWKNLTANEIVIVAQIARYHRKSPPTSDHEEFLALKRVEQRTVLVLGGILRVADALDRTHSGRIVRAGASATAEHITVRVEPAGLWDAELAMFNNKRDMLQIAAERPVVCISNEHG